MDEWYALKRTHFLGKPVAYICQNINGPCPLLAIANVLLLRGHLSLAEFSTEGDFVTARDLLEAVRRRLIATNPPLTGGNELARLTQEKTLNDVKQLLPSMLVGLDVNVRFHNITDFEYTVACAIFDMLDMQLVHGWLVDQQDMATMRVVGNKSYNELIERLVDYRGVLMTENNDGVAAATPADSITSETSAASSLLADITAVSSDGNKSIHTSPPTPVEVAQQSSPDLHTGFARPTIDVAPAPSQTTPAVSPASTPKKSPSQKTVETLVKERHLSDADAVGTATTLLEEGPILEEFFNSTASQLTYYGLVKLHEEVRERQLCVFFRNNHFSTLFKYDGALYLLATDAGYLDEPSIIWERLNEIDGDTEYVDANFQRVGASERQQTLFSNRQEQPIYDSALQQYQQLPSDGERIATGQDEGSRNVSSASDFEYEGAGGDRDETRGVHTIQGAESANTRHEGREDLDPDYLLALRLQEEEEAQAQRAKGRPVVTIAPRSMQPIGADRDDSSANVSESDESYSGCGGLRETSEDDSLPLTADGQVALSEEELEEQRKAELYYAQQKRQLDAQTAHLQQQHRMMEQEEQQRRSSQLQQQQAAAAGQGRFRGMRRPSGGEGSDCCIS